MLLRLLSIDLIDVLYYSTFFFSDPDDPEYIKQMRRPADIKEDMKQMGDRSRVSLVLNSEAFRKELEEIVDEQLKSGAHPASLIALQELSELLVPHSQFNQGGLGRGGKLLSLLFVCHYSRSSISFCYHISVV